MGHEAPIGAFAEYAAVSVNAVAKVPEYLSDEEAATEDYATTAMWLMDDAGQIQMCWRHGSRLALIPGVDSFRNIGHEEHICSWDEKNGYRFIR